MTCEVIHAAGLWNQEYMAKAVFNVALAVDNRDEDREVVLETVLASFRDVPRQDLLDAAEYVVHGGPALLDPVVTRLVRAFQLCPEYQRSA